MVYNWYPDDGEERSESEEPSEDEDEDEDDEDETEEEEESDEDDEDDTSLDVFANPRGNNIRNSARKIFKILDEAEYLGTFAYSSTQTLYPNPCLSVSGFGELALPISETEAKRLLEFGTASPFGLREKTIIDTKYRSSKQVDAQHISVRNDVFTNWINTTILNGIKQELGLGDFDDVQLSLYKLLVYTEGDHFTAHRDSQKEDGMIGTVAVILPSSFEGGTITASHDGKDLHFDFSKDCKFHMGIAAWYSDVVHSVAKVTSGYRVALIYNLVNRNTKQKASAGLNSNAKSLEEALSSLKSIAVFVLSHEYNSGDRFDGRFKGRDREIVTSLQRAIEEVGSCVMFSGELETESFLDDIYDSERYTHDHSVSELYHLAGGIKPRADHTFAWDSKLFSFGEPLEDLDPHKVEEDMDFMGNEGVETRKWYRRTCLVIYPKDEIVKMFLNQRGLTAVLSALDVERRKEPQILTILEIIIKTSLMLDSTNDESKRAMRTIYTLVKSISEIKMAWLLEQIAKWDRSNWKVASIFQFFENDTEGLFRMYLSPIIKHRMIDDGCSKELAVQAFSVLNWEKDAMEGYVRKALTDIPSEDEWQAINLAVIHVKPPAPKHARSSWQAISTRHHEYIIRGLGKRLRDNSTFHACKRESGQVYYSWTPKSKLPYDTNYGFSNSSSQNKDRLLSYYKVLLELTSAARNEYIPMFLENLTFPSVAELQNLYQNRLTKGCIKEFIAKYLLTTAEYIATDSLSLSFTSPQERFINNLVEAILWSYPVPERMPIVNNNLSLSETKRCSRRQCWLCDAVNNFLLDGRRSTASFKSVHGFKTHVLQLADELSRDRPNELDVSSQKGYTGQDASVTLTKIHLTKQRKALEEYQNDVKERREALGRIGLQTNVDGSLIDRIQSRAPVQSLQVIGVKRKA